ncbi:hypothetical protein FACS1894102_3690 [Spirochaetia bacterium]|nr:hypothetical protein FACS1894102_3690 [Spirochaetia bacterium]
MKKSILKLLKIICGSIISLVIMVCGGIIFLNSAPKAAPHSSETINIDAFTKTAEIEIKDGESGNSVGNRLYEAGLIRNVELWKLLTHTNRNFIKKGIYHFEYPQNQVSIHKLLQEGKEILVRVTIPEGVTIKKIASILNEKNICSESSFIEIANDAEVLKRLKINGNSMEGFLYPDTYLMPQPYGAEKTAALMVQNFFKHLRDIGINVNDASREDIYKKVILASIVEREYRDPDEAPIMGGVFLNRINRGMKLESCATVEYVITEIQNRPHPTRLFNKDIAIENQYNTYIFKGLPPGPISCPGEIALKAAFYPASSDYLFFRVVDPSQGKHYFSKTFDDHIKAGEIYLKNGT